MVACTDVVKYGLLTANLVIFVFGGTLFGVGMRTVGSLNASEKCRVPGSSLVYTALSLLTSAGPVLALSAVLGALGSFRPYKAIIIIYWLVAIGGLATLLSGFILVRSSWRQLPPDFTQKVTDTAYMCKHNQLVKQVWDATKNMFKDNPTFQCVEETVKKYTVGCLKLARSFILSHHSILSFISTVASCITVLGMILGIAIYRMREQYKSVPQGSIT